MKVREYQRNWRTWECRLSGIEEVPEGSCSNCSGDLSLAEENKELKQALRFRDSQIENLMKYIEDLEALDKSNERHQADTNRCVEEMKQNLMQWEIRAHHAELKCSRLKAQVEILKQSLDKVRTDLSRPDHTNDEQYIGDVASVRPTPPTPVSVHHMKGENADCAKGPPTVSVGDSVVIGRPRSASRQRRSAVHNGGQGSEIRRQYRLYKKADSSVTVDQTEKASEILPSGPFREMPVKSQTNTWGSVLVLPSIPQGKRKSQMCASPLNEWNSTFPQERVY